ncbi:glycosyltransferase [Acidimicrobiales bacterium]|nr:glycosyltransferase [Acidimicrobiales bacterium]
MSAVRTPIKPAAPAALFDTADGNQRVVVVAMKAQLRGRIRRSVTTLLEEGAEVTVLGLKSDKDFTVGLDHERLTVELLNPSSVYILLVRRQQSSAANRKRRTQQIGQSRALRAVTGVARTTRWKAKKTIDCILFAALQPTRRVWSALNRALIYEPAGLTETEEMGQPEEDPLAGSESVPEIHHHTGVADRLRISIRRIAEQLRLIPALRPVIAQMAMIVSLRWPLRRAVRLQTRRARRAWRQARRFKYRTLRWIRHRAIVFHRRLLRTRRRQQIFRLRTSQRVRRQRLLWKRRRAEERKNRVLTLRRWVLPLHRITRWADFWRVSRARVIHHRPDFVVSSDLPGLVGASLAAKTLGVRHVHDCHELYLESTNLQSLERTLLAPLERRYMRRADAIVMVNESIRTEYAERYAVDGVVVRNCAETGDIQAGQDLYQLTGMSADAQLVLYQGGFSVGRGLETVIAAVAEFPERAHLVMMGYGPMELPLRELAESQGVSDRVTFIEAVPPQQLLSTTATATIGLVPYQPVSANNRLALPNKIFEYTTVGLPVVVSDIPELARIANEGAGLTYDSFDPSDLARAVTEILAPGNIEAAEASSRSWGRSNTWEIEQRKLVNVWRNALKTLNTQGDD